MKKAFVCPWFGPHTPWHDRYMTNILPLVEKYGFDFMLPESLDLFKQRVGDILGVKCPIVTGGTKVHDYRPALGLLFEKELAGYDFWGHTDFDCVYGKIDNFISDTQLDELDIHSDCPWYMCGPWSLYRNTERVNKLFMAHPDWKSILEDPKTTGWIENDYSRMVERSGLRYKYTLYHSYENPENLSLRGDRLYDGSKEVMMYHFRRTKVWPLCPTK